MPLLVPGGCAMTEVSDPGNVSALSSEVDRLIEEALARHYPNPMFQPQRDALRPILEEFARKALGTVEGEKERLDRERDDAACNAETIGEMLGRSERDLADSREQARALAEACQRALDEMGESVSADCPWCNGEGGWIEAKGREPRLKPIRHREGCPITFIRAALASWDTSQKESR